MAERYTLSQIKDANKRAGYHYFDKDAMKFFAGSNWKTAKQKTTYKTRYDKTTGTNWLVVTDPWGKEHYHKFNATTGDLRFVNESDVPAKIRGV
jgi:hypothetical protein